MAQISPLFSKFRYALFSVFMLSLLGTFFGTIVLKGVIGRGVYETYAKNQADTFYSIFLANIWSKYDRFLLYALEEGDVELSDYTQFEVLMDEAKNVFQGALGVELYEAKNRLFTITKNKDLELDELTLEIISKKEVYKLNHDDDSLYIAAFAYPIEYADHMFDLRIYIDVSAILTQFDRLLIFISLFFILLAGILSILFYILLYRAEVAADEVKKEMFDGKRNTRSGGDITPSKFFSYINHELKTPLNAIIGFAEILKSETLGPLGDAKYKDFASDIHTSAIHLLSMVNNILEYSKLDNSESEIATESIVLSTLLRDIEADISGDMDAARISFYVGIADIGVKVQIDEAKLRQALLNLLYHAIQLTPADGRIELNMYANSETDSAIIEIKDNGYGIHPHELATIFSLALDDRENIDMSLPVANRLIELMKGKLHAKSKVGEGTTMTVILPIST